MTPEYVELCKRLNLPRPAAVGDYFLDTLTGEAGILTNGSGLCFLAGGFEAMVHGRIHDNMVWLPREGDWLDLIADRGFDLLNVAHVGDGVEYTGWSMKITNTESWEEYASYAPDRLTALARLYAAVKGIDLASIGHSVAQNPEARGD